MAPERGWYNDDSFWQALEPFMFTKERWEGTPDELDLLLELVELSPGAVICDVGCGPGRFSLEFARRGFQVTAIDRTLPYLESGRKRAADEGLVVEFVQADMRSFVRPNALDCAISMYTTFGYFEDAADNRQVLENIHRSLMNKKTVASYGTWKSPITAELIATGAISVSSIVLDRSDTYWLEMRPAEGGRYVIVRHSSDGQTIDVIPAPYNARTRVHEYGGGAYAVFNRTVYFSNYTDQRLYRQEPDKEPRAITPEGSMRYADYVMDKGRNRLICVREDHTTEGEAVNTIVALDLNGVNSGQILVSGNDFYASPRLSPDGSNLAWLTWNHPNMPWDGTELWVTEFGPDGMLGKPTLVAGALDESIFQPEWSPDGDLYFVSDRTGWWNLHRSHGGELQSLFEMEAEFGRAQWVFGMSTYAFLSTERLACTFLKQGVSHLAELDTSGGELETIKTPYQIINGLRATGGRLAYEAASPFDFYSIVEMVLENKSTRILRRNSELSFDEGYLSNPDTIEFPTENGKTAHAFYYAPNNRDYLNPAGEHPPLLVFSHGGPTGMTTQKLNLAVQFWTSRGFAVVDVNYGGSDGFGRSYRERLKGQWGIVDVDDCINAALYLAEQDLADIKRLAIRGGSAGGYTTLSALTFRDVFSAGASYYGVSDLAALARETHKFESRYLDGLVAPFPDRTRVYEERSPIHHTEHLSCAIILFQGLEDKVVPPNQAELMVEAVRHQGLPVAYLPFEGEQHGFRKAENIRRALEAELYFYGKVFGFQIADDVKPVQIENL